MSSSRLSGAINSGRFGSLPCAQDSKLCDSSLGAAVQKHLHGTANYAQLPKPAQQLCLDCQGPQSPNGPRTATLEEHTHHKQDSPGSQCIACHMPQIETEGPPNTFVRSHTFKFITPASTVKYKIPNPCNSCHGDKSAEWAKETVRHWNERSPWRLN